ncbi:TolC family protein [Dysgonomonas massiliensis]|uniref:TolC family protein n=1 Tax=Dysgonomonas massiliensis TaxID=2040292 RepID=UPI000C7847FE|nr:TolC family protein [Dysgonomonas massiliensis]
MFKKTLLASIVFFAICTQISIAQQLLTLDECRQLAIENNKSLKAASEQERVAYYQKREAFMNFFPKLSASGTYMHLSKDIHLIGKSSIPSELSLTIPGLGPINIPVDPKIQGALYNAGKISLSDIWMGGFTLTQPIFAGGKIVAYNDLRAYAEELAKTMNETKASDIIVEVDEGYWQVVSLVNKQKLAKSYLDVISQMSSDINELEKEGLATKADKLNVNVRLNEAEMTLTRANNGVSLAKMALAQLCGLEISDNITLADENIESLPDASAYDLTINQEEAISNRSEIRSLSLATQIYKKQEAIARSEFLPTAGIAVGYNWMNPNGADGLKYEFGGMWNVAVQVKVPLNFISSSAKLKAAKAQTRIKQFELEEAREKIKLQITQSNYKLAEANKKLKSAQKNCETADENLRYANAGFEEGVISALDAMQAHTAWIAAHADLIDAQIDVKLCRLYLDKALGRKLK